MDSLLVLSGVGGRGDRSGWTRGTGRQWLKTVLVPGSCAFWATGQTLSFIPSHKGSWITQDTKDRKWPKQNEQQASLCKVGGRPISSTLVFATTHVNVHTKLTHQLHVCPLISMQFGMLCVVRLLPTYQHTESYWKHSDEFLERKGPWHLRTLNVWPVDFSYLQSDVTRPGVWWDVSEMLPWWQYC